MVLNRIQSNLIQYPHLNVQPSGHCHIDQSIKTKQIDLAAHQVGDTQDLGQTLIRYVFCITTLYRRPL